MNMDGSIRSLSRDVILSAILLILPLNILLESEHSLVYTACVSCCASLYLKRESQIEKERERERKKERERERERERHRERERERERKRKRKRIREGWGDLILYFSCFPPSDPNMSPTLAPCDIPAAALIPLLLIDLHVCT